MSGRGAVAAVARLAKEEDNPYPPTTAVGYSPADPANGSNGAAGNSGAAKAWLVMEAALGELPTRNEAGGARPIRFEENLHSNGRVVGKLTGTLRLLDLPLCQQPQFGTLTESGIAFTGPAVVGEDGGGGGGNGNATVQRGDGGDEVARLGPLLESLSHALRRGDEGSRQSAAMELKELLVLSHKESLVCFLFKDVHSLHACRTLLLDLWDELLSHLESRALGFAARSDCYSLIALLLARAEIGCTLHDAGSGGVGMTPLRHVIRWKVLVQRTLAWVLNVVGEPPAGGDGPALRDFCARVLASAYFRLPKFGKEALDALQSPDVLDAEIPEFRALTFKLDCTDEPNIFATRGFEELPPLDWRLLHERVDDAVKAAGQPVAEFGGGGNNGGASGGGGNGQKKPTGGLTRALSSRPAAPNVVHESASEGALSVHSEGGDSAGSNSVNDSMNRLGGASDSAGDVTRSASLGGGTASESRDSSGLGSLLMSTVARAVGLSDGSSEIGRRGSSRRRRRSTAGADVNIATPEQVAALKASDELLESAIRQNAWRTRLRKRGHLFCRLHWEWIQEVCDSLDPATPPHFVAWQRLPGFKTLTICLLLEMRDKPIVHYSEPLLQLSNQLLRVTHLHSLLVKIVFLKASVHDVCAVSTTLNLLGSWMSALGQRLFADEKRAKERAEASPVSQPLLRSTFDFAFFFKGMATLFDSEHAQVLLKCLEFLCAARYQNPLSQHSLSPPQHTRETDTRIPPSLSLPPTQRNSYRHFDLLPEPQANELRTLVTSGARSSSPDLRSLVPLSTERYWRLALHWSPAVRKFFLHLLVYRLRRPCCWSMPSMGTRTRSCQPQVSLATLRGARHG